MEKAPPLSLDMDIVNLQDLFKKYLTVCESTIHKKNNLNKKYFTVCESTIHKKNNLKKKSEIMNEIKQYFS
jgi:hypothetical protein